MSGVGTGSTSYLPEGVVELARDAFAASAYDEGEKLENAAQLLAFFNRLNVNSTRRRCQKLLHAAAHERHWESLTQGGCSGAGKARAPPSLGLDFQCALDLALLSSSKRVADLFLRSSAAEGRTIRLSFSGRAVRGNSSDASAPEPSYSGDPTLSKVSKP